MYITVLKLALKPNGPIWIQSITLFLKPEFWYSDFLGASKCFRDWPSKCGRPNSIRKPSKCRLRPMKFWAVTLNLSYCILQSSSSKRAKNLAFRICQGLFPQEQWFVQKSVQNREKHSALINVELTCDFTCPIAYNCDILPKPKKGTCVHDENLPF